jgi:hypothetical protein
LYNYSAKFSTDFPRKRIFSNREWSIVTIGFGPGFRLIQRVQVLAQRRDDRLVLVRVLPEDVLDNHDGFLKERKSFEINTS